MINKNKKFEDALNELELIVNTMENDSIELDAALEKYQRGTELIKFCQEKLKNIEQQIKIFDPESNNLKDFNVNES